MVSKYFLRTLRRGYPFLSARVSAVKSLTIKTWLMPSAKRPLPQQAVTSVIRKGVALVPSPFPRHSIVERTSYISGLLVVVDA